MENEIALAAGYLRRMAPAAPPDYGMTSHEARRAFLKAAAILEGPDVKDAPIAHVIPVRWGDSVLGHIAIQIGSPENEAEDPSISLTYHNVHGESWGLSRVRSVDHPPLSDPETRRRPL